MIALGIVLIVVAAIIMAVNIGLFARNIDHRDPSGARIGVTVFANALAAITFWVGIAVLIIGILQSAGVL